jgi:transformation/transcription domain-associated protein
LRTQSEDYKNLRRQHEAAQQARQRAAAAAAAAAANATGSSDAAAGSTNESQPAAEVKTDATAPSAPPSQPVQANSQAPSLPGHIVNAAPGQQQQQAAQPSLAQVMGPKQPWEAVDEVVSVLKTAFPLLALTLENMCDQFNSRFKPSADEDVFRLVNALLNDGLQVSQTLASRLF